MVNLYYEGSGGSYDEPWTLGDVEIWAAEEHHLALFATEQDLRAGAQIIANDFGDDLPVGIYRGLLAY
jgi:hypothetical protein